MFEQVVKSCANYTIKIRVDANGGWDLEKAIHMSQWLAERGVSYIEQLVVLPKISPTGHRQFMA